MTADPTAILNDRFDEAMIAAFGDDLPEGASALLSPSKNPKFGDFQANGAMGLAKRLGKLAYQAVLRAPFNHEG